MVQKTVTLTVHVNKAQEHVPSPASIFFRFHAVFEINSSNSRLRPLGNPGSVKLKRFDVFSPSSNQYISVKSFQSPSGIMVTSRHLFAVNHIISETLVLLVLT